MTSTGFHRFMRQMTTEKLFDEGKYLVIYLYPESVKLDERMFFLWTKEELAEMKRAGSAARCEQIPAYQDRLLAWKSLIVVSGSPYRIDTTAFADQVDNIQHCRIVILVLRSGTTTVSRPSTSPTSHSPSSRTSPTQRTSQYPSTSPYTPRTSTIASFSMPRSV